MFILKNMQMHVIETASNGVVNQQTIFSFQQEGTLVFAEYAGGQVAKGFLVGELSEDGLSLSFAYCQLHTDGTLDNGKSKADILVVNGKLRLIEHFEWASRPGEKGVNIFEEIIYV